MLLATEPGVVGKGALPVLIRSGSVGTGTVPVIVGTVVRPEVLTGIDTENKFHQSGTEKIFSISIPIYKLSITYLYVFELFFKLNFELT